MQRNPTNTQRTRDADPPSKSMCKNCGFQHLKKQCPAFGKQCRKCNKLNHFAKCCRGAKRKVEAVEQSESSPKSDLMFVGAIDHNNTTELGTDECYTTLDIEGHLVKFKVDTSSQVNILPSSVYKQLKVRSKLALTIDCKLSFTKHIDTVCKKANSMLAFIRRNLKSCQRQIKADAYLMYVRPILEYAAVVWAPHTKCNIDRLEAVQRRAARFVTSDYNRTSSVTVMLDNLNWSTLISRRQTSRLCLLYKIIHNLVDVTLPNYITPATRFTRGHDQKFILPQPRIDAYKFNFFPDSIRLWNSLPLETVHAHTIDSFINYLNLYR